MKFSMNQNIMKELKTQLNKLHDYRSFQIIYIAPKLILIIFPLIVSFMGIKHPIREHLMPMPNSNFQNLQSKLVKWFVCFFLMAALDLRCCARAFSSCGERGLLFIAVRGPLIVVASLVAKHRLQAHGLQQLSHTGSVVVARGLQSTGSAVVAHGLSCSVACGIFPDQGSNPCSLHWQAAS